MVESHHDGGAVAAGRVERRLDAVKLLVVVGRGKKKGKAEANKTKARTARPVFWFFLLLLFLLFLLLWCVRVFYLLHALFLVLQRVDLAAEGLVLAL